MCAYMKIKTCYIHTWSYFDQKPKMCKYESSQIEYTQLYFFLLFPEYVHSSS